MRFSIGNVLSRSFGVFFGEFPSLFAIALIIYVPFMILVVLMSGGSPEAAVDGLVDVELPGAEVAPPSTGDQLTSLLSTVLSYLIAAAVSYAVFQRLRGREVSIGDSLSVGFKRLLPVLGVAILTMLVIGLGFVLLIIPGLILMCVLYVATTAAVVERPGVVGAMNRSAELTKGHRWEIFGLVLIVGVMSFAVGFVLLMAFGVTENVLLFTILSGLLGLVFSLFGAVCQVVAYHDLRVEKEGVDTEVIAAVFD